MEKILREVIAEDRSLLFRGNELIVVLEKRVPLNLQRQFTPIKTALKLNIGKFFATEKDDYIARYNVIKSLVEGGMSEEKINLVLKTFDRALSTIGDSTTDLTDISRLKNRIAELEAQIKSVHSNSVNEIAKEKSAEISNQSGKKFIWDSDKTFVPKN